jgi:protein-S-isoprenylcysteine O-methyltransferase Ste14
LLQHDLAIMESMRLLSNSENWSLIALAVSLVLAYVLFFAPGHQHVFGDRNDPLSLVVSIMMVAAVIAELNVLFTLSRKGAR